MSTTWYFARDDMEFGPFTAVQLREHADRGQLRPQDFVWQSGMKRRVAAARVKDLFPPAQRRAHPDELHASLNLGRRPDEPAVHAALFAPEDAKLVPLGNEALMPAPAPAVPAEIAPLDPGTTTQPEARKWRVVRMKGGVILSQDGGVLRYRKKCPTCAYEDRSVVYLPLQGGVCRSNFFCPRCRKNQPVEAHFAC